MLLSLLERSSGAEDRSAARHSGSATAEGAGARTKSRVGHLESYSTDVSRRTEREPGIALSRATSPGTAGRCAICNEVVREQSPGPRVHHHAPRTPAPRKRAKELGALRPFDAACARAGVASGRYQRARRDWSILSRAACGS